MARSLILPDAAYEKGAVSGDVNIPVGGEYCTISIKRLGWPDTGKDVISGTIFITLDGREWVAFGGFSDVGGNNLDKSGALRTEQAIMVGPVPEPKNQLRMVRLSLEVLSGLQTKAEAESLAASAAAPAESK